MVGVSVARPLQAAPALGWAFPIDDHRRRELLGRVLRWRDRHGDNYQGDNHHGGDQSIGPFAGVRLCGTDVFFLAAWTLAPDDPASAERLLRAIHDGTLGERDPRLSISLGGLHLEGADLSGAELEGAVLNGVRLQHANLQGACLSGASLLLAQLDGADLRGAVLDRADLTGAHLKAASLIAVHAEGALLGDSCLEGASLAGAHLASADLRDARLAGANLLHASLAGADLRGAVFDSVTSFEGVRVSDRAHGPAVLGDVAWDGARLMRTDWHALRRVGDERFASWRGGAATYVPVLRAYRQLAAALHAQGLHEDASRLAYRGCVWQRRLRLRRLQLLRYLGSWLLAISAGYGYRPGRAVVWFTAIVFGFALVYFQLPHLLNVGLAPLPWSQSVVTSLTVSSGTALYSLATQPHSPVSPFALTEGTLGLLDALGFISALVLRLAARR